MKNLRISSQLAIGFGLMVLLVVAGSGRGWHEALRHLAPALSAPAPIGGQARPAVAGEWQEI